jgi:hypothetical protein
MTNGFVEIAPIIYERIKKIKASVRSVDFISVTSSQASVWIAGIDENNQSDEEAARPL